MTISTLPPDPRRRDFLAAGGETVFPVTFPWYDNLDLIVFRTRAAAVSILVLGTDYTLAGVGQQAGGTLTLAAAALAGDRIAIVSAMPAGRTTALVDGGPLRARSRNDEDNRLWIAIQQILEAEVRALRLPPSEPPGDVELPGRAARTDSLFAFDATGNPIVLPIATLIGMVVSAGGGVGGGILSLDGYVLLGTEDNDAFLIEQSLLDALIDYVGTVGGFLPLTGGTLTGNLVLPGNAAAALQAVPKQQLDAAIATRLPLTGGTLTGALVLAADAVDPLGAVTLQQLEAATDNAVDASGRLLTIRTFLASGTWTPTPGCARALLIARGAGGGGGSGTDTGAGGLGGEGEWAQRWLTSGIPTSATVTVGAGGAGGTSGGSGGTGGTTSVVAGADTLLSAGGGSGGGGSGGAGAGGTGGTGATRRRRGARGEAPGSGLTGSTGSPGAAADANSGAGGGGGGSIGAGSTSGGTGGTGWVEIWEFAA
jgi:hypothetical protein